MMGKHRRIATFSYLSLGLLAVLILSALSYRAIRQHQNALALAIHTPNGVEEAFFVRIGGIDQFVQIRGEDRSNPVILILHGGPGDDLVAFTPIFRAWEQPFTIVQWGQRGAGKTYGRNGKHEGELTINRMTNDGIEVAEYLRTRLHKDKIILLGDSWGTILGIQMVKRRPDLFFAYVGTGQIVDTRNREAILYSALLDKVRGAHDVDGIRKLESIGPPPYKTYADLGVQRAVSGRYAVESDRGYRALVEPIVLFAPNYSLADIYDLANAWRFSGPRLYKEFEAYDATKLGLKFDIPVFFFEGERDTITPAELAEQYLQSIDAPAKGFVVLQNAGHFAIFTQANVFLKELVSRVRPLATLRPFG